MSGFYGIDNSREVIRVHVKKCDGLMQPETKKFSLDPQITSFEMLQNILARAFDIKSDFTISYLSMDRGQEVYLSMLSDWDMDAAFQNASDPCLKLKVDLKPFDDTLEDWDIIAPVEIPQFRMNFLDKNRFLGNITDTISNHVERTMTHVQRAIGMKSEDEHMYKPIKAAMTDMEFRNYLDCDGHMVKPEEFRLSIYQGGVEPSLRRVVWRHLLNIYPEDLSGRERFDYMKKKENEYVSLRNKWKQSFEAGTVSAEVKHVASLVKKDVLRTDRTHKHYAGGDESRNLISLYNLLVTYALTHPEIAYCQGMSDIASPLLVVQKEEAQAYLCFCGLMTRLRSNFLFNGEAIMTKLQHLSLLVEFYDPPFKKYLKDIGAEDLFFCYRWLLLEMKREFPFDDALYMLEVMWSTLPPSPPQGSLRLTDPDYSPALIALSMSPHSPSFSIRQTQYAHLLAKRRLSTTVTSEASSPKTPTSHMVNTDTHGCITESVKENDENSDSGNTESSTADNCKPESNVEVKVLESSTDSSNGSPKCASKADEFSDAVDDAESCSLVKSGSTSKSQSIERFPSLISGSFEESSNGRDEEVPEDSNGENVVSQTNSLSNGEGCQGEAHCSVGRVDELISENNMIANHFSSSVGCIQKEPHAKDSSSMRTLEDARCKEESKSDENSDFVEIENQFHLSLEEPAPPAVVQKKDIPQKKNIPQIKGSFFSGMRKILSSPKRRPGRAQQVKQNSNQRGKPQSDINKEKAVNKSNNTTVNDKFEHIGKITDDGMDGEHTLFDMNLAQPEQKERSDTDSGTGSLTSSHNSSHNHRSHSDHNTHRLSSTNSNHSATVGMGNRETFDNDGNATSVGNASSSPVFLDNYYELNEMKKSKDSDVNDDGISDCRAVSESREMEASRLKQLPPPDEFGYGNPFLMFLCLTVLLQHRNVVIKTEMEYDELAMYFDKMVRKHNVHKVLHQTRHMYTEYIRMQQRRLMEQEDVNFSV